MWRLALADVHHGRCHQYYGPRTPQLRRGSTRRTIRKRSPTLLAIPSLTDGMDVQPLVVTSETFDTPATQGTMDDGSQSQAVRVHCQAPVKPTPKTGRKTHEFRGSRAAFYAHLQGAGRLDRLADEHHTYYGNAFSKAVRDLNLR